MATGQGVNFGFTSTGADGLARDFRKVGDNSAIAAKGARLCADALDKQRKAADVSAGATIALAKADQILADAEEELSGRAALADAALRGQGDAAKKAGRDSAEAAAGVSALAGTGGIPGGGLGALIAGGVALSPVIATLSVGLAGLGAAAVSTIGPILKAGTATKEAQKALASLDPAQRAAYDSLGLLKTQFGGFAKSLEPQVLKVFAGGLRIASGLMADVQPVAKATGDALSGFLGQIDKEFRSRTWQDFFGFMAKEAGPDITLVANAILPLLDTLPKLLTDIQPIAVQFLQAAGGAARLADAAVTLNEKIQHLGTASGQSSGFLGRLADAGKKAVAQMLPGIPAAQALGKWLGVVGGNSDKAASGTGAAGDAFKGAAPHAQSYAQWVAQSAKATTALMDAQAAAVSTQLAYGNDILTSANDAQTFHDKLQASKGMIGLHTQAQRDSFGAANTYIGDLVRQASSAVASGHGTDAAIAAIRNGLPALDSAKTKNKLYWQEVKTLTDYLHQLELIKFINTPIHVTGTGKWSVTGTTITPGLAHGPQNIGAAPTSTGAAAGLYVSRGTGPTADDVMIRASRGELIVPAGMVKAGAVDHLRGAIPGFAAGGVAGSYGPAAVSGLPPWIGGRINATDTAIAQNTAQAILNAMAKAQAAAKTAALNPFAGISGVPSGGPIGAGAAAAQAFAKSIMWAYGWTMAQWPYLQQLWNLESGWRWNATNPSSGAYGIPQSYPAGKMASAGADWRTNPATQIRWGMGYIKQVYGTPQATMAQYYNHPGGVGSYAKGGLVGVPGYATGGTVAQQGQTFLNAWRSRHGGPYALATGPRTLNQQIPPLAAAYGRARALASAGGLSAGQHRFWAAAAASDARLLATRRKELSVEQAWRGQLTAADTTLTRQIAAAGNLPGFARPVRGWKAQIAGHKHTIGEITAMIGLTAAQQAAAKAAAARAIAARPPRQSPFAAWSLLPGPSTATTAGAYRFDQGGTLAPGWNPPLYNGTGRPETLVPGGGGGNLTVNLNISGPVGSQRELETWLGAAVDKLARQGRLGYAFRRSGSAA